MRIREQHLYPAIIVAIAAANGCAGSENHAGAPTDIEVVIAPVHSPGRGTGQIESECLNAPGAAAPGGRVHNRFLWCQRMATPLVMLVDGVPENAGRVNAEAVAYGRDDGNRSVEVFYRSTSVEFFGNPEVNPTTIFMVSIDCQDVSSGPFTPPACAVEGARAAQTLATWELNHEPFRWVVTSDETASLNPDRVSRHRFKFNFQFETDGRLSDTAEDAFHTIRCDSATYFTFRPKACILDDVLPHLQYSAAPGSSVRGVAEHILKAFTVPSGTFPLPVPTGSNKIIPGKYTGNPSDPGLHRIVYKSPVWQANSAEKDRACNLRPPYENTGLDPQQYDRTTQDCDEFPFASTAEGAASPFWDFSVLGVNRSQNRCAGAALKNFYMEDRILHNEDTFWVEITENEAGAGAAQCFLSAGDEPSDDDDLGGGGGNAPIPDTPPIVSAGPDVTADEGQRVRLNGSAADADTPPTASWSYRAVAGVDPGTTCTFENGDSPAPVFSCTDDGTFEVTLTANDGFHDPVSDTAVVQLRNVAPTLSLAGPQAWQPFRARTAVALQTSFVDPGANDTHTCVVRWDDDSVDTFAATARTCDRSHTFTRAGMFTINVTVTDDDGGSDAKSVMVIVYDPDGPFMNADGSIPSPAGAFTGNPGFVGEERFHLEGHYHHLSDVPTGNAQTWLPGTNFRLEPGSVGLDWMVVTPDGKIAVRGTGTLQGQPGAYGFVFYGYDGCTGRSTRCQPGPDRFRIVVWSLSASPNPGAGTIYDNRPQAGYDIDVAEPQALRSGLVLIQPPN
jgi:hypothetical protein